MNAVFVLPLLAVLVTAEPAPAVHIPGTKLDLGMAEGQLRPGDFVAIQDGGEIARQGTSKFFGIPCRTKLYFRGEQLRRAAFEADSIAAYDMDNMENQMRHAKLWRECVRLEPENRACDWLGAVRIHIEYQNGHLAATVTAQEDGEAVEPDAAAPVVAPTVASSTPVASPAATAPIMNVGAPTGPGAALAVAPAVASPISIASPAATATTMNVGAPAVAALAVPAQPQDTAKPSAVLPDTLRISLPERNPASVWPRMEVIPALEYPAAARAAGVQGVVWVTTLVDVDGSVRAAHVDHGGIPALNEAALAWVRRAHFAPCERDGQRYQFWVRVAARFVP